MKTYWMPRGFRPLYDGGCDWFGVRLWPLWLEWTWKNKQNEV